MRICFKAAKYNNRLKRIMWLSIHIWKTLAKKGNIYFYFLNISLYNKGLKKKKEVLHETSGHCW